MTRHTSWQPICGCRCERPDHVASTAGPHFCELHDVRHGRLLVPANERCREIEHPEVAWRERREGWKPTKCGCFGTLADKPEFVFRYRDLDDVEHREEFNSVHWKGDHDTVPLRGLHRRQRRVAPAWDDYRLHTPTMTALTFEADDEPDVDPDDEEALLSDEKQASEEPQEIETADAPPSVKRAARQGRRGIGDADQRGTNMSFRAWPPYYDFTRRPRLLVPIARPWSIIARQGTTDLQWGAPAEAWDTASVWRRQQRAETLTWLRDRTRSAVIFDCDGVPRTPRPFELDGLRERTGRSAIKLREERQRDFHRPNTTFWRPMNQWIDRVSSTPGLRGALRGQAFDLEWSQP